MYRKPGAAWRGNSRQGKTKKIKGGVTYYVKKNDKDSKRTGTKECAAAIQ
jgi:hypothetical protein